MQVKLLRIVHTGVKLILRSFTFKNLLFLEIVKLHQIEKSTIYCPQTIFYVLSIRFKICSNPIVASVQYPIHFVMHRNQEQVNIIHIIYNCTEEGVVSSGIGLGLWQLFAAIQKVFVQFEIVQGFLSTLIYDFMYRYVQKYLVLFEFRTCNKKKCVICAIRQDWIFAI